MKYIVRPVGVLAILYGCVITYDFLVVNMSLTQTEMLFLHWPDILKIVCVFLFGIVLYNVDD